MTPLPDRIATLFCHHEVLLSGGGTREQIRHAFPCGLQSCVDEWLEALELLAEEYEHESPDRLAHAVRKAHDIAKAGEQSLLTELSRLQGVVDAKSGRT